MPPDAPNDLPEDDEEEVEFEMEVRELEPEEVEATAEMLAKAFEDGPLMAVIAPDEATRPEIARWFFESLVVYGLLYGDAFGAVEDDGDVQAAAVWWAPENVEPDDERATESGLADGLAVVGPEGWMRLQALSRAMAELHRQAAPDPHWYLALLGVNPDVQGQGIGGEVLAASLEFIDEEGYPAYLETSVERNVRFYERYGFKVTGETTIESLGLKLWGMRREPA